MDLQPSQCSHAQRLTQALGNYSIALDASYPGVGKTSYIAKILRKQILIFDEAQRCKTMRSQNAELLIAAKQSGFPTLLCSATATSTPLEMRALRYALELHHLDNYWS